MATASERADAAGLADHDPHGLVPPPGAGFASPGPSVRLLRDESAEHPFALAVAAAWSCYGARPAKVENVVALLHGPAPEGLDPARAAERAGRRDRAMRLYADLFAAGHHTTMQHANFVFVLDDVSRLAVWSFFHSHPFYNSEQVSQRYREVSGERMTVPDLPPAQRAVYDAAIARSVEGYRRLTELLTPDMAERYARVFPSRVKAQGEEARRRVADAVQKRAQEVARYVLPLATPAHLYHTVNALTLLRYYVLANGPDAPDEVRRIVNEMVRQVLAGDPEEIVRDPVRVGLGEVVRDGVQFRHRGVPPEPDQLVQPGARLRADPPIEQLRIDIRDRFLQLHGIAVVAVFRLDGDVPELVSGLVFRVMEQERVPEHVAGEDFVIVEGWAGDPRCQRPDEQVQALDADSAVLATPGWLRTGGDLPHQLRVPLPEHREGRLRGEQNVRVGDLEVDPHDLPEVARFEAKRFRPGVAHRAVPASVRLAADVEERPGIAEGDRLQPPRQRDWQRGGDQEFEMGGRAVPVLLDQDRAAV